MQRWSLDAGDNKVRSFISVGIRCSLRCFLLCLFTLVLAPNTAQAQAPSLVVGPDEMIFGDELSVTQVLTVFGDGGAATFSATASVTKRLPGRQHLSSAISIALAAFDTRQLKMLQIGRRTNMRACGAAGSALQWH